MPYRSHGGEKVANNSDGISRSTSISGRWSELYFKHGKVP